MSDRNKEVLKLQLKFIAAPKLIKLLDEILDLIEGSGLFSAEEFKALQQETENGLLDEKMNERRR